VFFLIKDLLKRRLRVSVDEKQDRSIVAAVVRVTDHVRAGWGGSYRPAKGREEVAGFDRFGCHV